MVSRWIVALIVMVILLSLLIDISPINFQKNVNVFGRNFTLSYPFNFPLKLGLDLQGGTQLVLQTQMDNILEADQDAALESAREVIERRVNLYGVSEALVQTSKVGQDRRILVELPGLKDASAAADLIGRTAQLEFREMIATPAAESTPSALNILDEFKPTGLTGADLKKAEVVFGQGTTSGPQVSLVFTDTGAQEFAEITKRNIGKPLGMFLDGLPISWPPPIVNQEIIGGNAVITGQFSLEEAKNLAIQLNAGALPVPIKILEQRSIGPTLGSESIQKSLIAGGIGLLVVIVFMIAYYGYFGLIADIALLIYTIIILAIFKTGLFIFPPITLTLAGIAGFILSIGMAVDANILIFERMREETRWGKNERSSSLNKTIALERGFKRAWSSIWASNVSTLMTALILFMTGTSLVKGFAVTLAIGVLVSMFTAIVVTRTLLRLIVKK